LVVSIPLLLFFGYPCAALKKDFPAAHGNLFLSLFPFTKLLFQYKKEKRKEKEGKREKD